MTEKSFGTAASAGTADDGAFSPSYRTYALLLLTGVYTMNFIDRQILSILLEPIKLDLGLSDAQLGFLSGISFAIFYATLGIPIAMLADRTNRRNIIAFTLALFSAMTAVCGLAQNFVHLALARIGVGIGEAGTSPPAHSIIADMFPTKERGTAMGIYSLGVNFGILIGFVVGGWVAQWYGWRAAFHIVGLPGLLIALLVFLTLREPKRGQSDGYKQDSSPAPHPIAVFKFLWSQRSFRHLAIGSGLAAFIGYGVVTWLPAYLMRSFEMEPGPIGTYLAFIIGVAGGAGTFLGGYVADKLSHRDIRWNTWVPAIAGLIALPFSFGIYYFATSGEMALLFFVLPAFLGNLYLPTSLAMIQSVSTLRSRAAASALWLFIVNMIGMGIGPQAVGFLSDYYQQFFGIESLRYALFTLSFVGIWSVFHLYLASRTLKADIARAQALSDGEDDPALVGTKA